MAGKGIESKISRYIYDVGFIDGFVVKYNTTTAVTITSGQVEANGKRYTLSANASHSMTSLASGADFHYIYIDDDASSPPAATIIDSTTEPSWSDSERGWYNGDDRCIGVVYSAVGSATVAYFDILSLSDKTFRVEWPAYNGLSMSIANNINPTGAWQEPNVVNTDYFTPVNAVEVRLRILGDDLLARAAVYCVNSESAAINTNVYDTATQIIGFGNVTWPGWVNLGPSRQIKLGGDADDDNVLSARVSGCAYMR
jgi:hypothetical protein